MARQEAQSKLLYYPTPLSVVELIAPWLQVTPGSHIRLADPCVGQGEALAVLANTLRPAAGRIETWGVELSPARADEAAGRIDVVLPASFYMVQWSPASVSLLFNNPPYDWSSSVDDQGRKIRHEVLFAGQATPRLAPGGVHILIVPQRILGEEQLARHWCGWYTRSLAFRFPEAEYQAFGQVVLIGIRKDHFQMPTKAQMEGFLACGREDAHLPALDDCEPDGRYRVPEAPAKVRFAYTPFSDEEMVAAASRVNLLGSPDWERATYVRPIGAPIFPLTQIKLGHLSMLISAGELGVVQLQTPEGPALVKGMLQKYRVRDTRNNHDDKGRVRSISIEEKEKLASVITLVKADGERRNVTGTREVGDFIRQYAGPLADAVLAKNRPFYNWDPTPTEMAVVNRCGLGLPPLPGRSERGLFDIQKHFAIAAKRKLSAGGHIIAMSEMGFGVRLG